MSDNGIVWEEPPDPRMGQGGPPRVWIPLLEPLMRQPGKWARVRELKTPKSASAFAAHIRKASAGLSTSVLIPPGRWEAVSRTVENDGARHFYVYARYLGPEDEETA